MKMVLCSFGSPKGRDSDVLAESEEQSRLMSTVWRDDVRQGKKYKYTQPRPFGGLQSVGATRAHRVFLS